MQVSVTVAGLSRLFGPDLRGVVDVVVEAEACGIDQVLLPDHVLIGRQLEDYPYGTFPVSADEPWLEPLTMLAAAAARTDSIRLGTGVLIAPLRSPAVLAKTLATLDVLAPGRLDIGVGLGWQADEYTAVGRSFADRGRLLDRVLATCDALWSGEPVDVEAGAGTASDVRSLPAPARDGRPRWWFGAALGDRMLARIGRWGHGWMPMQAGPTEVAEGRERIAAALASVGRDMDAFGIRAHGPVRSDRDGRLDVGATAAMAVALRDAGATHLSWALPLVARDRAAVPEALARLVEVGEQLGG